MITRRQVLLVGALGLSAGSVLNVPAQAQGRKPRVGILSGLERRKSIVTPLLLQSLAALGYAEGRQMLLEFRSGDGTPALYPKLARELIDANCDVIFALVSEPLARAFVDARTTSPVVFIATEYDPLEVGIVRSLARPEGNITGVYVPRALTAKSVELAQEILPRVKRYLVFVDSHSTDQLAHVANAAQARGVELRVIEFGRPPYDYAGGFQSGRRAGAGLFIGLSSPVFAENREVLSGEIVRFRMPAIVPSFLAGRPGSLISYTSNPAKIVRRAAELGVKILQGAKPADVPVEAVAEFELTVNLRTAKMLGLNVPYSVLARATKVIE